LIPLEIIDGCLFADKDVIEYIEINYDFSLFQINNFFGIHDKKSVFVDRYRFFKVMGISIPNPIPMILQ